MHTGDFAAANDGSCKSTATVDVTGSGDNDHDGDSDSSLPTLEDLISQAKATRKERMAMSEGGQKPTGPERQQPVYNRNVRGGLTTGNRAAGHSADADAHVGSSLCREGSQGEHTES